MDFKLLFNINICTYLIFLSIFYFQICNELIFPINLFSLPLFLSFLRMPLLCCPFGAVSRHPIFTVFFLLSGALFAFFLHFIFRHPSTYSSSIDFPRSGFFGSGPSRPDIPDLVPFTVNVSEKELVELKRRLKGARIGHEQLEDVDSFEYGFPLGELLKWKDRWEKEYDWRKAEAELNKMGEHFRTQIEGLQIHFIRARPPNPTSYRRIVPLLICHGWPGSVFEFHRLIPILTDPRSNSVHRIPSADVAFDVVVPSIPGYGWSEQPHKRGFNQMVTARIFHKLMVDRLGFRRFVAQGGDWGSLVVSNLARMFPESVSGIHLNMVNLALTSPRHWLLTVLGYLAPQWIFSDSEHFNLANSNIISHLLELVRESGYMHIQATKPDTVGVALNDSPLGLLSYILEKYSTWTNLKFRDLPDGGLEKKFSHDELLTMVSIYWFNGNILASQRYYKEFFASDTSTQKLQSTFVRVPTAYTAFPHELLSPPKELVDLAYNLTRMTIFEDGGHFAAFENARWLAEDIVQFVNTLQ